MSGQKPCFLTATDPAYGVCANELLAIKVMEANLAQLVHPNPQVKAVVKLPPGEERGATMICNARYQGRRTWEGMP
jgi:hypothetical protein